MKFLNFNTYMFEPDDTYWSRALQTLPRENLEKILFDTTLQSGMLTGLELIQQPIPNLTVLVKTGRAVYRDATTKRARVLELHADLSLDLSMFLPAGSPTTIKIVASPRLNTTTEAPITVNNAPATLLDPDGTNPAHPDHDPAFTPYAFDPLEMDDILIEVDSTPSGNQIVLAEVTLSAAQTQILNSNINNAVRLFASNSGALAALQEKVAALEATVEAHGATLGDHTTRIGALEVSVGGFTTSLGSVQSGVADHEARLDALEPTVSSHTTTLSSHATTLGDHEARLDAIDVAFTLVDMLHTAFAFVDNTRISSTVLAIPASWDGKRVLAIVGTAQVKTSTFGNIVLFLKESGGARRETCRYAEQNSANQVALSGTYMWGTYNHGAAGSLQLEIAGSNGESGAGLLDGNPGDIDPQTVTVTFLVYQ